MISSTNHSVTKEVIKESLEKSKVSLKAKKTAKKVFRDSKQLHRKYTQGLILNISDYFKNAFKAKPNVLEALEGDFLFAYESGSKNTFIECLASFIVQILLEKSLQKVIRLKKESSALLTNDDFFPLGRDMGVRIFFDGITTWECIIRKI